MMIEIRHLRTLKTLRDSGSLVAAAALLHTTQSALSHQIKALEEQWGVALFVRKSRPLNFTHAGRRLLALAEKVLPEVQAAERDLARLGSGSAGRLNIVIECHSCFQWLLPAMDRFRAHWPEVEMDLTLGFNFEPLPALARGDVDLVISSDPQDRPDLAYEPLFRFQALLAMSNEHPLRAKASIAPEDLAGEVLITYPVERGRLDVFKYFLDPARIEPREQRTSELTAMIMQLVASRRGVSVLPDWALAEYLERHYVDARPLGRDGIWGTLYAAVRSDERGLAYIRDFVETARTVSFEVLKGIKPTASPAGVP